MTASDLFQAGRLREAIDVQIAKVKAAPADQRARLFLFELFLFTGELDRARKQLAVLTYDDPKHTAAVEQFRFALEAETKRRAVFAGTAAPEWLSTADGHLTRRLDAIHALARGQTADARTILDEANAAVPVLTGSLNGKPFEGLFDADERFGTVIEVFGSGGVYSWVPLEAVQSITLNPPAAPRDVVWRAAHLVLDNGVEGDVLLPGLYPNTHESAEELLTLGRGTDWVESAGITRGVGGRLLCTAGTFVPYQTVQQVVVGSTPA
jgi:type VI secretion system protein ImpE